MRTTVLLLAAVVASSLATVGCASQADGEDSPATTEGALGTQSASQKYNLKEYSMVTGIVAMGADARKLYEDIKANGGKDLGNHAVLAGLAALR